MCQVLSPRSLQRRFSFNCEFHHNYLIGYLIDYLMFDVIITSSEIFQLLLGCKIIIRLQVYFILSNLDCQILILKFVTMFKNPVKFI